MDASNIIPQGASGEEGNPSYQSFLGQAKEKA
jgi:hypothetical protein